MKANILDGKVISRDLREKLKQTIKDLETPPSLAAIITSDDESIKAYVKSKDKVCSKMGVLTHNYYFPKDSKIEEILNLIGKLNDSPKISGILLEFPLGEELDKDRLVSAILPEKDVDGITPLNAGKLYARKSCLIPCTAKGILKLIKHTGINISGKHAVVVGRSNIVGKPSAALLLNENATVTICHSKTENLKEETKRADILVSAAGRPNLITGDMIKKGAVVIDAGTTMVKGKLMGDVVFEEACEVASYITPVPGGVGSMTTTMLIENLVEANILKCL